MGNYKLQKHNKSHLEQIQVMSIKMRTERTLTAWWITLPFIGRGSRPCARTYGVSQFTVCVNSHHVPPSTLSVFSVCSDSSQRFQQLYTQGSRRSQHQTTAGHEQYHVREFCFCQITSEIWNSFTKLPECCSGSPNMKRVRHLTQPELNKA